MLTSDRLKGNLDAKEVLQMCDGVEADWEALGLGHVRADGNEAFFIVVKWPAMNRLRMSIGLQETDFHITVGFKPRDVHDVEKDETTLLP
jgi:hypothetical protein